MFEYKPWDGDGPVPVFRSTAEDYRMLLAEVDRLMVLVNGLTNYTHHGPSCSLSHPMYVREGCTCGLTRLLLPERPQ